MNWKEQPHLFYGFRVLTKSRPNINDADIIDGMFLDSFDPENEYMDDEQRKACKLIARPISDMSDEEEREFKRIVNDISIPMELEVLSGDRNSYIQDASQLKYLLSIGVYPFEDTADVIFKNKEQS